MRLFVLAGESSGDLLGANMLERLNQHTSVRVTGVGGPALIEAGLRPLFPMDDLAVMGWRDVYMRLPLLLWRLKQTVDYILRTKPDLIVLIDSQEFSQRVAAKVKQRWPAAKIVLYVAPSVWAWKPERAQKIKPLYDEILSVLPFEPQVFQKLGGPNTSYVGHIAERLAPVGLNPVRDRFLALAGSRKGEVLRNLDQIVPSLDWLQKSRDDLKITLPTLERLKRPIAKRTKTIKADVTTGRDAFKTSLSRGHAAIAVSGTVTLELGCADVPHVMTYLAEPKMMKHYEANGRPLINLNNIIVGRKFVPEVLGTYGLAQSIYRETEQLLNSDKAMQAQRAGFEEMRHKMQEGEPEAPRQDIAERLLSHLN